MVIEYATWLLNKAAEYSLASFASWSSFTAALAKVAATFTDFESGMAWPYLLASLLIAGGVFVWTGQRDAMRTRSFKTFLFPTSSVSSFIRNS